MDILIKRLAELQIQAQQLVSQREQLYKAIKDIDTNLHQVVGAINELQKLTQEGDKNESDQADQPTVSRCPNEAE